MFGTHTHAHSLRCVRNNSRVLALLHCAYPHSRSRLLITRSPKATMSINLIVMPPGGQVPDNNLQYLPAKIETTLEEDTNVGNFFDSYTKPDENTDVLQNTLRGYPVRGDRFQIPSSHVGMVFEEDRQPLVEHTDRTFRQTNHFTDFVVWNYDQQPSRNDGLTMAVEGFCLTEELHKRVDPIQLELFLMTAAESSDSRKKDE